MPKIAKPLTNTEVSKASPRAKQYSLVDGGGLYLRVQPSGIKTWLFYYQKPDTKKRSNLSLGSYPSVSLAEARVKARAERKILLKGGDPKQHKDDLKKEKEMEAKQTLKLVAEKWFAVKKGSITPDYANDIWCSLENHIFPKLGDYPIGKITAPLVIEALNPLANRGKLETVKRLIQRVNEVMTFSVNAGLIEHNPVSGVGKTFAPPDKKNYPALKPEELPEFIRALSQASIKKVTRCAVEWQLHTMTRPNEAAEARWEEIDLDKKVWIIPPERMKKKRQHIVPLSRQAIALLEHIKPISGHLEHIFPSDRTPNKPMNKGSANVAMKRMGFKGRLVAHGMRSIASTTLNEEGFDPDLIESALAHVNGSEVRRAYNRAEYVERRRPMMQWWSDHIEKAATGDMSLSGGVKGLRVVA